MICKDFNFFGCRHSFGKLRVNLSCKVAIIEHDIKLILKLEFNTLNYIPNLSIVSCRSRGTSAVRTIVLSSP